MNFYSDQMSKWQMALFPGSEKNFYKQKKKTPFFEQKMFLFSCRIVTWMKPKAQKNSIFFLYIFLVV